MQQQDERIVMEKNDYKSKGFDMIFCFLLISILIQKFFLNAPIKQYVVELFIFSICFLYEVVGYYRVGINLWICKESGKQVKLLKIIIEGIVTSGIMIVVMGLTKIKDIIICVLTSLIFYVGGTLITAFAIKRRKRIIDMELDSEDEEE